MTTSEKLWVSLLLVSLLISYHKKNCFQYDGAHFTELINKNPFPLARKLSIIPLKISLTGPAVIVPDLTLCITKFLDKRN